MIKPLSPFKFFSSNKKKASIILVSIFLAVFCISFIIAMIESAFNTWEENGMQDYKKSTWIINSSKNPSIDQKTIDKIKSFEATDKMFAVGIGSVKFRCVMGQSPVHIYMSQDDDTNKEILDRFNCKLVNGRMPAKNSNEIILSSKVLKNKKLKIGDYIGQEVDETEWLVGKYKIVGEIAGEFTFGIATGVDKNYDISEFEKLPEGFEHSGINSLLVFAKDGKLEDMNNEIAKLPKTEIRYFSYDKEVAEITNEKKDMFNILNIIIVSVVICMSICCACLIYNFYSARNKQFAIFYALGHNKRKLRKMISGELLIICVLGWILGYLLSFPALKIADISIYKPLGQSMTMFSKRALRYTLIIPLIVCICSLFPVLINVSRKDLVSVIEGRN